MGVFLGIDTSNYTTSLAVVKDGRVISSYKLPVKVKENERGIRQSDALFCHTVNLPMLFGKAGKLDISAVGVSQKPRDVEGSYMPCFLAGVSVAQAIASTVGVNLYKFSHQRGHIVAALYSCKRLDLIDKEFIAFHVSGGTTEILHVHDGSIDLIGGTLDLNAGQVIDRVGVMLGLSFPCGAALEKISCDFLECDSRTFVRNLSCNLSGLENIAQRMYQNDDDKSKIAGFVLKSVMRTIDKLSENVRAKYADLPIIYAGGVMSNIKFREKLSQRRDVYFAEAEYSCDNAAGIALMCEEMYLRECRTDARS